MRVSAGRAYVEWTEHQFFRYRGCAPDVDDPRRAAGNADLTVDAWVGEDREGGEPQRVRVAREEAAKEVCLGCPVMVQCDVYANSVTVDGKLVEPVGVRGGRTALERHQMLVRARVASPAAPDRRFDTPQKRAVLRAFAVCWEPFEVARVAGVDVRTANWQRSNLTTLLGLPRTASRAQFLAAAVGRGLLVGVRVVVDDGSVPAVAPPTRLPDLELLPGAVADLAPVALPGAGSGSGPVPVPVPVPARDEGPRRTEPAAPPARAVPPAPRAAAVDPYEPTRVRAPRRDRFADITGQLALWEAKLADGLADVHDLFPDTGSTRLEAAA